MTAKAMELVDYEPIEKWINTFSHLAGAILTIVGWVVLLRLSRTTLETVAYSIYCAAIFMMFANSSLYHGVRKSRFAYIMRAVDHSSIFLAIAGTYTPILLIGFDGWFRWTAFALIWAAAFTGIVIKIVSFAKRDVKKTAKITMVMYLAMGWVSVFILPGMVTAFGWGPLIANFIGGVLYTVGAVFYGMKGLRFNHAIWHFFILFAAASQYAGMVLIGLR